MFAIVEIYGKQYKVAKGDRVLVNSKIDIAEGVMPDILDAWSTDSGRCKFRSCLASVLMP